MKKPILLFSAFLISICTAACGAAGELQVYEYSGMNDDTDYFDYTGETYRYENKQGRDEKTAEETRRFRFMGEEYELTYSETDAKEFLPYAEDYYYAGDIEFAFVENTKQLSGICCYDGAALDISEKKELSQEQDYRQIADNVAKEYINLGKYAVECSTRVTVFEEKNGVAESSYENFDYFYPGNKDEDEIRYTFTYTREYKGYETCEMVCVTLNEEGQLCNFQLNAVGLFDNTNKSVAKRTSVDEKIKQKLDGICREEYSVRDMNSDVILCVNQEGDYFYVAMVDTVVESSEKGTEDEAVCVFILADE